MDERLQNIVNHRSKKFKSIIELKYSASYLNNTKWEKLLNNLIEEMNEVVVKYKLVYDDVIKETIIDMIDDRPFFIEPILYEEIEWIEFPKQYENWVNENNKKAGKKTYHQDVNILMEHLKMIGEFNLDIFESGIRLYAYQTKN